jgi:hypothetical protein
VAGANLAVTWVDPETGETRTGPRYVAACQNRWWSVETWKKDGEGKEDRRVTPFRCKSWRCEGQCREWCQDCDFARVLAAIESRENWTVNILTYPHAEWPDVQALFKFGVVSWSRLRKRLVHRYGKIEYIQTWEVHKSGYPHLNLCISNESLYLLALKDFYRLKSDILDPLGKACGFGHWLYCAPIKSSAAYANYITNKAAELTGAAAKDQLPLNAPPHFRRLRSSQKLLPPRLKNDTVTGRLHQRDCEYVSRVYDVPMAKEKQE